jgi:hypothetical protein
MRANRSDRHHTGALIRALTLSILVAGTGVAKTGSGAPVVASTQNSFLTCVVSVDNDSSGAKAKLVDCAASMLSYREKSDSFGRRVADTYVAVQVQVGTGDSEDSYHLHAVTLERPSEAGEQLSRDKRIITMVSQQGQNLTRRNLIARGLDGLSIVLGGLTPFRFFTGDFKSSVALFQGPLINSYKSTFPDLTTGQISLLNGQGMGVQSDVISRDAPSSMILFFPRDSFAEIASTNRGLKMKRVDANYFAQNHIALQVHVHAGYFQEPAATDASKPDPKPAAASAATAPAATAPAASTVGAEASAARK